MKKREASLCVIVPMYNEEKSAPRCVDSILGELQKQKIKSGLIVVNDGSTDKTLALLMKKRERYQKLLCVVSHDKNRGYGEALKTGIRTAAKHAYDFVLFMDSDLTNNPKDIPKFVAKMDISVDCVKASRYSGGNVVGVPLFRRIISRAGNTLAALCFRVGLTDCTNGFRMVRVAKLQNIEFHENAFAIILEELYELKKHGATFSFVPVVLTSRKTTASHFSYSLRTFFDYGKYAIKAALL